MGYVHTGKLFESARHISFPQVEIPNEYLLTVSAAMDQGNCGSCWACSATTTLRDMHILHDSDPGELGVNYLLDCDKAEDACNGGDLLGAQFLVTRGPFLDSFYPYTAAQGACKKGKAASSAASVQLLGGDNGPSVYDITYAISQLKSPVITGMAAGNALQEYDNGILDDCSGAQLNHAVEIIGYNVNENYWVVKNSWGTSFGENGTFRIKMTAPDGSRCEQIASMGVVYQLSASAPVEVPWYKKLWNYLHAA